MKQNQTNNSENLPKAIFQKGDLLVADIYAYKENKLLPKLSPKNYVIELGKDEYLTNFDKLLIGQKKADVILVNYSIKKETLVSLKIFVHFKSLNKAPNKKALQKMQKAQMRFKELESDLATEKERNKNLEMQNIKFTLKQAELEASLVKKASELQTKAQVKMQEKIAHQQKIFEEKILLAQKFGSQKLFEILLPVISNLEVAISWGVQSQNHEVSNYVKGFLSLVQQIDAIFADHHIFKIVPQIGESFNPEHHEIVERTHGNNLPQETISALTQPGYMLYERVLIPAKVKVEY